MPAFTFGIRAVPILEIPCHPRATRLRLRRRKEAMDKLSAEGRHIHEILKSSISDDLDHRFKVHGDDLLKSMTKLLQDTTRTLDCLISSRIDGVRSEINLDMEQIRQEMDRLDKLEGD